jgi:hypothetical protein
MKTTTGQQTFKTRNIRQDFAPNNLNNCLIPLPSTWVNLLDPPTPNCYDEALLMCQYLGGYWAAWIPDFGEIKLHSGQFCRLE